MLGHEEGSCKKKNAVSQVRKEWRVVEKEQPNIRMVEEHNP